MVGQRRISTAVRQRLQSARAEILMASHVCSLHGKLSEAKRLGQLADSLQKWIDHYIEREAL